MSYTHTMAHRHEVRHIDGTTVLTLYGDEGVTEYAMTKGLAHRLAQALAPDADRARERAAREERLASGGPDRFEDAQPDELGRTPY